MADYDYGDARMASATREAVLKELAREKRKRVIREYIQKAKVNARGLQKILKKTAFKRSKAPKSIIKPTGRTTILLNQPVYLEDEPKYYKEGVKQLKKRLFYK